MMSLDKAAYWHLKKRGGGRVKTSQLIKNKKKKQVN